MEGETMKGRAWLVCAIALLISVAMLFGVTSFAADIPVPSFDKWTFYDGVWEVTDMGLLQAESKGSNTSAYVALSQKGEKLVYEWTIWFLDTRGGNGPLAGVHILSNDATITTNRGNSYLIWQDNKNFVIYRCAETGGMPTIAKKESTVAPNDTFTYRVEVDTVKKTIDAYRDGELFVSVEDPDMFVSGEYISTRTNVTAALFSNFKFSAE
jgi:hypothetical protein